MSEFTREQLEEIAAMSIFLTKPAIVCAQVAAFAIALLDRAEKAEAERDDANDERDDAVDRWARRAREAEAELDASEKEAKMYAARALAAEERQEKAEAERDSFRLEADRLREELREAEKRMKAWGCPDFDFICLNCGRETPCITEADLRPGDPGVPCTFDLTYPQMIERLRRYEDRQRKAEAERDEARAMKVPATTEAVTLAEMGEKVARTEAWAAKEELRIAEAERDRLQRALDLSEQAHREVREVCEQHGVENALGLSVRLESVCAERDRLREELREAEEAIREAIEELSDGVTFEDERVSYVEMQVGREWRIEWLQSPAVRRARERAGRG